MRSGDDALAPDHIRPALLQCALVSRARMDPREKGREPWPSAVEPGPRGGRLERKAHLNVGGAELAAGEPFVLPKFAFEEVEVRGDLRFDVRALDPPRNGTRDGSRKATALGPSRCGRTPASGAAAA